MNVYPTGRADTKDMKETSDGSVKETWRSYGAQRKKNNAPPFLFFFSSNTTFSTDVLQHEYIIYILFYTYIFQIRSEIHNGMIQGEFFRL